MKKPMSATECPTCGAAVAADAPLCSECGSPNPGHEGVETRLRKYWSAPDLGLLAGVVLAVVGVVLLGAQMWLWAALALVLAAAIVVLRVEAGRRATGAAVARVSAQRRVVGARSRGQIELFRLRRELAELQAERSRAYQELGRATHESDADRRRPGRPRRWTTSPPASRRRRRRSRPCSARWSSASGRRRPKATPPEPARVPEPFPPPDEGDPPEPAHVPEPSPDDPVPEPEPPPRAGDRHGRERPEARTPDRPDGARRPAAVLQQKPFETENPRWGRAGTPAFSPKSSRWLTLAASV